MKDGLWRTCGSHGSLVKDSNIVSESRDSYEGRDRAARKVAEKEIWSREPKDTRESREVKSIGPSLKDSKAPKELNHARDMRDAKNSLQLRETRDSTKRGDALQLWDVHEKTSIHDTRGSKESHVKQKSWDRSGRSDTRDSRESRTSMSASDRSSGTLVFSTFPVCVSPCI